MTPAELSNLHPRLYHVSAAGSGASILANGLLSTKAILDAWGGTDEQKRKLMTKRRPIPVTISHPARGKIVLNDNGPLSEAKLEQCLDDGLTPAQWLEILNSRVFFFVNERQLTRLLNARLNREVAKDILVLDTRRLAQAYGDKIEIVPINSGNTNYAAARRGYSTFAPLFETDYGHWRRRRGNKNADKIKEVAVRGSIPDVSQFLLELQSGQR